MRLYAAAVSGDSDLDSAFETLMQVGAGALVVGSDPFHVSRRERIVSLAARNHIPTLYSQREYVKAGGLMSYGASSTSTFVIVGDYAGRILKGAKPADLPVIQPTKYELVINLKTAKVLNFEFPPLVRALADEVIE
jgi:putative ABC transport system substrate-binding protein